MKKTLLSISLALATLAGSGAVIAQDTNGAGGFIGAKVGNAHWDAQGATENRFAYDVSGGYRWSLAPNQSLGAELGYVDFGTIHDRNALGHSSLAADAVTLGANYRYTLANDSTYVMGRAGYLRWHGKARTTIDGVGRFSDSNRGNGWYAGAAIGHDFTPVFGMNVGYDFHRANNDGNHVNFGVASVGAEYRF